jgi:hypothetical protein
MSQYGPFATTAAIAGALIAIFSMLLLKMFGRTKKWTWLTGQDAPFMVTAGARAAAIGAIALTFLTISKSNYVWFGAGAVLCGLLTLILIVQLESLRRIHVREVPVVGPKGKQAGSQQVVIGTEEDMTPEAKKDYAKARKAEGGLSLIEFLAGYGARRMYDPESAWAATILSKVHSRLTLHLMSILLLGVLTLYLAASSIEMATRDQPLPAEQTNPKSAAKGTSAKR